MNVPKAFVRRIIGHQNRNLITYKSKYNVELGYDRALITDDIFQIHEMTNITLKGKEMNVRNVENEVKKYLFGLKVMTLYLMNTDYHFIKNSICQLKSIIDPADLRLRKKDFKNEREIKHSFYYIPSNNKDLVIIGFDSELKKAEKSTREFLLRQNNLEYNYSLCFLCPTYFTTQLNKFYDDNTSLFKKRNLFVRIYDPNYTRKHINLYFEGKWKDITDVKNLLFKFFIDNDKNYQKELAAQTSDNGSNLSVKKKTAISEFEQYAYNQDTN